MNEKEKKSREEIFSRRDRFWIQMSCISDPSAVEIRTSRNEEVSQATKGDDSVTWIGRVK